MNTAARPRHASPDLAWFKSSYSSDEGGNCLEVAYHWHKSSYSGSQGGECVEVAAHPAAVHIRDSKVTDSPILTVTPHAWSTFISHAG
ncbi:DUF397 domain-containing protein [Streptomyces iconiensis]|uniref:DUF397 domain-containing protein n=1 Tax=Streptomyces iconiensis TaxID=1384038 RepID=A0ABT7A6H1_9ACTN|nr:DUF397 domain-containing protein [Streptomyces iconiensis]MDJ1136938.1 DUF397 domain-containing protein [Streptomyces iconiensis]